VGAENLNVLIPMAGLGKRFSDAGYDLPKPLVDVCGKPMIEVVLNALGFEKAHHIFLVRKEHLSVIGPILNNLRPGCTITTVNEVTDGAARTCLLASHQIDNDEPLLIANCDQITRIGDFSPFDDGVIFTFASTSPANSYVSFDESGYVAQVAEKKVISNAATCGVYWFKHGRDMVAAAESMIHKGIKTNGEYYLAPVYNEMIDDGKYIIAIRAFEHVSLGTPEDLRLYLESKKNR